jgi:DNA (cytosine-5)-methyltransferase 1
MKSVPKPSMARSPNSNPSLQAARVKGSRQKQSHADRGGKDSKQGSGQPIGTFIDLFAGCGGLSLGLMLAGWKGMFAIEKDSFAFETLQTNLIGPRSRFSYAWPEWLDQSPCTIDYFLNHHRDDLASLRGTVDLIAGGPPCQGFSLAGRRNRKDSRNRAVHRYLEVVSLLQPPLLLIENVVGIAVEFGKKAREKSRGVKKGRPAKSYAVRIAEQLDTLGYDVQTTFIRALDFGIPQFRPRFILVGIRRDVLSDRRFKIETLLGEHREAFLTSKGLPTTRSVTVSQAISDLETRGRDLVDCTDSPGFRQIAYSGPRTAYQKVLHGNLNGTAPNSMRLVNHRPETRKRFKEIQKTCRLGVQLNVHDRERFGLKKVSTTPLDPDKPSHTLTTLPDDLLHYSEPRILTAREYARIQSFPDWYEFRGKYATGGYLRKIECPRYTQIGNAVPPFLAEILGMTLEKLKESVPEVNRTGSPNRRK